MDLIANNKGLFSLLTVQENSTKCRGSTILASILTTFLSRGDVVCYVDIQRTLSRIDDGGTHFVVCTPKFRSFINECKAGGKLIVLDGKDIIGCESGETISNPQPTKEIHIGKWNMSDIFKEAPLVHTFFPALILRLKQCQTSELQSMPPDQKSGEIKLEVEDALESALSHFDAIFIDCFELLLIEDLNASIAFLRKLLMHKKKKRSIVLLVDSCMLDSFVVSQLDQLSNAILFPLETVLNEATTSPHIDVSCTLYYKRQGKKAGKVNQSFKIELDGHAANPLHIIDIKQTDKNKMAAAVAMKAPLATGMHSPSLSGTGDEAKLARLQARVPFSLRATRAEVEGRDQNLILPHKAKVMQEEECVAEYFPAPSSPSGYYESKFSEIYKFSGHEHDDEYEEMDPDDDLDV